MDYTFSYKPYTESVLRKISLFLYLLN